MVKIELNTSETSIEELEDMIVLLDHEIERKKKIRNMPNPLDKYNTAGIVGGAG